MERLGPENSALLAALHGRAFERPWNSNEIESLLDNPAAFAIGDAEGFVLAWAAAGDAEILTLAVLPGRRRKGKGHALVAAACKLAAERGATAVHLEVAENNVAARALYAKLGFADAGRRAGYYSGAVDAVIMRRALPL